MLSLLNIHDNVYINMERSSVINLLKHDESIISDLKNDLVSLLFYIRDINCGLGFKNVSYWMFMELYYAYPEEIISYLKLFIKYGCWQDLNIIGFIALSDLTYYNDPWYKDSLTIDELEERKTNINKLIDRIVDLFCEQLNNDKNGSGPSLCAKWSSREGRKYWSIGRRVALRMNPAKTRAEKYSSYKKYNNLVRNLSRRSPVTEDIMCNGKWSNIDPEKVPIKCRAKNNSALLNRCSENQYQIRTIDEDRIMCSLNFNKYDDKRERKSDNIRTLIKKSTDNLEKLLNSDRYLEIREISAKIYDNFALIDEDFILL